MTDPTPAALAALTEALASIKDGPYHYGAYDTKEFAAAILAHPAMKALGPTWSELNHEELADLARKAAAYDRLVVIAGATGGVGPAAIAAALEQGDE